MVHNLLPLQTAIYSNLAQCRDVKVKNNSAVCKTT